MNCSVCDKAVPIDGDYIICSKCQSGLHYNCSGVSKSTWKAKGTQKKGEWECAKCRSRSRLNSAEDEPTEPTFIALKTMMEKLFAKQENIIMEKMEEMKSMVASMEVRVGGMMEELRAVQEESSILRKDLEELKIAVECERQYNRSRNIILTGIPFAKLALFLAR